MSMIRCAECDCEKNSDYFDFENIDGKDVCCDCLAIQEVLIERESIGVNHPCMLGLI